MRRYDRWENQRNTVKSFVSNFEVGSDKVRFRVVQYQNEVFPVTDNQGVSWSRGSDINDLNTALDTLVHADSACQACSQFHKAYSSNRGFRLQFRHSRPDVPKFILAFTDGINGDESIEDIKEDLRVGRQWAADHNAQIFVVAIGDRETFTADNPEGLSLSKEYFVNDVSNFMTTGSQGWNALDTVVPTITNMICTRIREIFESLI